LIGAIRGIKNGKTEKQRLKDWRSLARFAREKGKESGEDSEIADLVVDYILERKRIRGEAPLKKSYLQNILINLEVMATRRGLNLRSFQVIKNLEKSLNLLLLRERPEKAKMISLPEVQLLLKNVTEETGVALALMLPTGARFQDIQRIQKEDIITMPTKTKPVLSMRIYQTKTIRKRLHQRWLTMTIPRQLVKYLEQRLESVLMGEKIVTISYRKFMNWIKNTTGNPQLSTYSLRLRTLEELRRRATSIEEIQMVSFHRNPDQLRWYLEAPLPDEMRTQMRLTSWLK
jgi:hypothetical protein